MRKKSHLGGGFKYFLCSPRKLGKIPNLTNIFQMGGKKPFQDPPYDLGPLAVQLEVCEVLVGSGVEIVEVGGRKPPCFFFWVDLYGTMTLFRRDYGFIWVCGFIWVYI